MATAKGLLLLRGCWHPSGSGLGRSTNQSGYIAGVSQGRSRAFRAACSVESKLGRHFEWGSAYHQWKNCQFPLSNERAKNRIGGEVLYTTRGGDFPEPLEHTARAKGFVFARLLTVADGVVRLELDYFSTY